MAVRPSLKQPGGKMPRGARVKRDGFVIAVERRGISSGIALVSAKAPPALCPVCKEPHSEERLLLWGRLIPGVTLKAIGTEGVQIPTQVPILIIPEEPWVLITVGQLSIFFGHRATFCAHWSPWSSFLPGSTAIKELSEWAKHYFNYSSRCNWGSVLFSH